MSDLLDHLHALQLASLWTLAPKPQLMQAAGIHGKIVELKQVKKALLI